MHTKFKCISQAHWVRIHFFPHRYPDLQYKTVVQLATPTIHTYELMWGALFPIFLVCLPVLYRFLPFLTLITPMVFVFSPIMYICIYLYLCSPIYSEHSHCVSLWAPTIFQLSEAWTLEASDHLLLLKDLSLILGSDSTCFVRLSFAALDASWTSTFRASSHFDCTKVRSRSFLH